MKRWKERLSKFLGNKDRPEQQQAEQFRQHQRQQQGPVSGAPGSDGKPPRRPKAPVSQGSARGSARGSRASYDNSMLGRSSQRPSGFGQLSGAEGAKVSHSCGTAVSQSSSSGRSLLRLRRLISDAAISSSSTSMSSSTQSGRVDTCGLLRTRGCMLQGRRMSNPIAWPAGRLMPAVLLAGAWHRHGRQVGQVHAQPACRCGSRITTDQLQLTGRLRERASEC